MNPRTRRAKRHRRKFRAWWRAGERLSRVGTFCNARYRWPEITFESLKEAIDWMHDQPHMFRWRYTGRQISVNPFLSIMHSAEDT